MTTTIVGALVNIFLSCFSQLYANNNSGNIPLWFDSLATISLNGEVGFGISDPGLSREASREQARLRGIALMALCEHLQFNKMTDLYAVQYLANEKINQDNFMVELTSSFDTTGLIINKEYYNKYGECFLLLSKSSKSRNKNQNNFKVSCTLFFTNYNKQEKIGIMEFLISNNTDSGVFKFQKRVHNQRCSIESYMNGKRVPIRSTTFQYISYGQSNISTVSPLNSWDETLRNSFWSGFMSAFLKSVASNFNENVKMGHKYDGALEKKQSLTRTLVDMHYAVSINVLGLSDNKISINTIINSN